MVYVVLYLLDYYIILVDIINVLHIISPFNNYILMVNILCTMYDIFDPEDLLSKIIFLFEISEYFVFICFVNK